MKIAIVGYGSMGREIEAVAKSKNHIVSEIFDVEKPISQGDYSLAIEFTQPDAVLGNIMKLAEMGKQIVVGTTGWHKHLDKVKDIVQSNGVGLVWASNFSIGMNLYFKIIQQAASLFDKFDDYDTIMHEYHHKRKKDSPSGTAVTISEILLDNLSAKSEILYETSNEQIKENQLHSTSTRGGEIPGTHTVIFDSFADSIELTHRARNRNGFAVGSVLAAEIIKDKKGVYDFRDLI